VDSCFRRDDIKDNFFYRAVIMEKKPYQRKVGEFEIRILPDGRLVFVAPDEDLAKVAEKLEPTNLNQENQDEPELKS